MDISCSNWKAWYDRMPGSEPTLHVMGTCRVPGGYSIRLERAEPQGINPDILLLNLIAEDLTPDGPNPLNVTRRIKNLAFTLKQTKKRLILLGQNIKLPDDFTGLVHEISSPLPSADAIAPHKKVRSRSEL